MMAISFCEFEFRTFYTIKFGVFEVGLLLVTVMYRKMFGAKIFAIFNCAQNLHINDAHADIKRFKPTVHGMPRFTV